MRSAGPATLSAPWIYRRLRPERRLDRLGRAQAQFLAEARADQLHPLREAVDQADRDRDRGQPEES
ncbi:hypothetical protein [Streptomyces sp. NPDC003379]